MSKKIIFFSLTFIAAAIGAVVASTKTNKEYIAPITETETETNGKAQAVTVSPAVPTQVQFADKTIDLTRSDRYERMDREILSFTYSHINTILQMKRANRLFPIVVPILKECSVPEDFKYLMIIESNGDIYARSPVGAAGLWQFMEATGREYGLEVNSAIDERYHIEKATRAACKYLKSAYAEYGDWLTVAASYNCGKGNVSKRIDAQKESHAIDLALLPETSRYIFRLMAIKEIFENPEKYGFHLQERDLYKPIPILTTLQVDTTIASLPDLAAKYILNYMQLRDANPWMRSTTLPNKSRRKYEIKIPDAKAINSMYAK